MRRTFIVLSIALSIIFLPGLASDAESGSPRRVIRPTGKIEQPRYDEIVDLSNSPYAKFRLNDKWGCIEKRAPEKVLVPARYEDIGAFQLEDIIKVKRNGKWGYLNIRIGEENVYSVWDEVGNFFPLPGNLNPVETTAPFARASAKYDKMEYYNGYTAAVSLKDKWGLIDRYGNELVAPRYSRIEWFQNGAAKIAQNGLWGFINEAGKEFVPPIYDEVGVFSEEMAAVAFKSLDTKKNLYGYVDKTGKVIVEPQYDHAGEFHDGWAVVRSHGKQWYIDKTGKEMHLPKYVDLSYFREGRAAVAVVDPKARKRKYGFIDTAGKEVIPPQYDDVNAFVHGYASVRIDHGPGKYTYFNIDKSGRRVERKPMAGFWVRVRLKDKWGYIDGEGNEIFPVQYDELPAAIGGQLFNRFKQNGKYGYFDQRAKVIVPAKYDEAPEDLLAGKHQVRMVKVRANGKYGYLSRDTGKEIISVIYDDVPEFREYAKVPEKMKVKLNGKWGYIDLQGREISAFHYEDDPCAFEKSRGEHYVFGNQAEMKQQPDAASARIAQLPAGTKIKVIGKTDKELTIGDVTDTWYEVKYEDKRGYVWGASIADAAGLVQIKGKEAVAVIRTRTPDTDYCNHRKFEMQLVVDGKIIDQVFDKKLSNGTVKVRSLKYETFKDFSAPLSLLVMTFDGYHSDFEHTVELYYYYLEDGKLAKVLDWGLFVEHKGFNGTGTVIMPDKNAGKDTITVKYKLSQPLFGKKSGEKHYTWSWEKKTFIPGIEEKLR